MEEMQLSRGGPARKELEQELNEAVRERKFEKAAELRDKMQHLSKPADGKRAEIAVLLRLLFLFPPLRSAFGARHRKLRLKQTALGSLCAAFRALLRRIQRLSAPFRPLLRRVLPRLGGRLLHQPFARLSGRLFLRLRPVFALTLRRIFRPAGHDGLRRPAFMLRRSSIMSLLAHVFRSFCSAG